MEPPGWWWGPRSADADAGVDLHLQAGDVPRLVRGQVDHRVRDVVQVHAGDGDPVLEDGSEVGHGSEEVVEAGDVDARRDAGRMDAVDADALVRQLVGQ